MQRCLCEVRLLCRDFRRGQREHSLPLEAQLTSRSTAWQEWCAVFRRHYKAERAHPASDRRPVPQRGDDQRLGARMARRRGTRRPSQPQVREATLAWRALELQEARQVRERAPQPRGAARKHAPEVHQAVLAHEHLWRDLRPRREL